MIARNFERAFCRETGIRPVAYVEAQRVEGSATSPGNDRPQHGRCATACGFARVETMRRAFRRVLPVAPGQYRRHFRSS